jgi:acyl-CoA synthetase (AMP-forming)/AMP-acid ligase II
MQGELHALMVLAAERWPHKPAFVAGARSSSYGDLNRQSGRLAASLRGLGLRRGDRVLLVLDGTAEFLVCYYAILKAGAVVVPHNPDCRRETLVRAIGHAEARAIILEGKHVRLLEGLSAEVSTLAHVISVGPAKLEQPGHLEHTELVSLLAGPEELHHGGAGGDDLASLVYTSGTTGRPKGVMLSHRNVIANVRSIVQYLELTSSDVMAMVLPFYYVYGTSVLHTHVAAGGTIAMVGSLTFPATLLKGIQTQGCTGFAGVPSTFARLAQLDLSQFDLSSLRYLTQAGGPMSPALTRKMMEAVPQAQLFVMYGQTEASARLTYLPPSHLPRKLGSVGVPIPGVSIRVVDEAGNEVARGVQGEVVARGENVMLGYWQDAEASARVLRPEGLHTGDIGWMDADGFLYLVGRQSEMIKSGGHRIGPAEIEEVIERLPEVAECAVVGVPDELLGESIAALVVLRPGASIGQDAVQRHVLEYLPRHMLPGVVCFVGALPRTPSGKIRRADALSLVPEGAHR